MKDIPVFTSEYGVASLGLKEIPYRKEAYIRIRSTEQPGALLGECIDFCRACGAEKIYAKGHSVLSKYPLHTAVWKLSATANPQEEKVENLWPVTEETVGLWRQFMNERLESVDNAATLEKRDEMEILSLGGAYFVHKDGALLGGGWLVDGELRLVASAVKGAGERVMHTLMSIQPQQQITLQVASTNKRALRLYERLGFLKTEEISRWYKVF